MEPYLSIENTSYLNHQSQMQRFFFKSWNPFSCLWSIKMLVFHHEKSLSPEKTVAIPLRISTVDFTQARGWLWSPATQTVKHEQPSQSARFKQGKTLGESDQWRLSLTGVQNKEFICRKLLQTPVEIPTIFGRFVVFSKEKGSLSCFWFLLG